MQTVPDSSDDCEVLAIIVPAECTMVELAK
jgi:hypothetical protein